MDEKLLDARIADTAVICERTCTPRFLGFLSESESARAQSLLKKQNAKFSFFGGFDDAERTMLACLPAWCEECEFPITAFTVTYRECDILTHRDFLGSLMGLGIVRESIGDILVEKSRAVIFVTNDIAPFVESQLERVGRVGVTVKRGADYPLPNHGTLEHFSDTVASLRLDCVVSALINASRNGAVEAIEGGIVAVNSIMCDKTTRNVQSGDRITVRGKGKFFIDDVSSLSKKGRIILKYSKYTG